LHLPGRSAAFLLGVFLFVLIASTPLMAGTLVVGNPPDFATGNCFPFGCNYDQFTANNEYQQVYSNTLFSGPITITGLEFYNTQQDRGGTGMNTGTFTIDLSTTLADWNTLSTTPATWAGTIPRFSVAAWLRPGPSAIPCRSPFPHPLLTRPVWAPTF
jgi:hypothetical protein